MLHRSILAKNELEGRSRTKGMVGSECVVLNHEADFKSKEIGGGWRFPYQAMWQYAYRRFPPKWPMVISHLCGERKCLNVAHYIVEHWKINLHERRRCHDAIDRWLKQNQRTRARNTQYTVAMCHGTDHVCKHTENPCFLSV